MVDVKHRGQLVDLAISGHEINFFSDSHLIHKVPRDHAPKFIKVVANSKKLVAILKDKQNLFSTLSLFYKLS